MAEERIATSLVRTSRDRDELRSLLQTWLATKLPAGADPQVPPLSSSSATGMSSETVLFAATWTDGTETRTEDLVVRIAPHPDDVPVFPSYDMKGQFETIRLVGQLTSVAVPVVRWLEEDASILGTPFFVMDRISGSAPPDNPPYTFGGNWALRRQRRAAPHDAGSHHRRHRRTARHRQSRRDLRVPFHTRGDRRPATPRCVARWPAPGTGMTGPSPIQGCARR